MTTTRVYALSLFVLVTLALVGAAWMFRYERLPAIHQAGVTLYFDRWFHRTCYQWGLGPLECERPTASPAATVLRDTTDPLARIRAERAKQQAVAESLARQR